jgi:hypothetical protein
MVNGLNASNFFDYVGLRISNCSGFHRRPTEFVRFDSQDFFGSRNHRCAFLIAALDVGEFPPSANNCCTASIQTGRPS